MKFATRRFVCVEVLAGLTLLQAFAACRAPAPQMVQPTDQGTVDARTKDEPVALPTYLERGEALLRVQFVTKETGAPMPGVSASIWPRDRSSFGSIGIHSSTAQFGEVPSSDVEGRATFVVPCDVAFSIEVLDHAYSSVSLAVEPLREGTQREIVVPIATQDDIAFVGRIVSEEDGSAIANAQVRLEFDAFWSKDRPDDPAATSGSDGSFEMRAASWQHPYASVSAPGFAQAAFRVTNRHSGAATALVVKMQRCATLSARISDSDGAPVSGARIELSTSPRQLMQGDDGDDSYLTIENLTWTGTTGADGRCTIDDLVPDVPIDVVYEAPDKLRRHESEPLRLSPSERRDFALVHHPGSTISGRIEDQFHRPVADCRVWLLPGGDDERGFLNSWSEPFARVIPDDAGNFRIQDVPPGSWWIGPFDERERNFDERDAVLIAPIAHTIRIADGANPGEVVLRADRGLYIAGRVLKPGGEPAPDISVDVQSDDLWIDDETDSDGEFKIGPLCEGTWTLTAGEGTSFAESDPVDAAAGSKDVVLQLHLGGHLRVQVVDAATGQSCAAQVQVARTGGTQWIGRETQGGEIDFDGRAAGSYSLLANTDDDRVAFVGGIDLAPGGDVGPIVLRMQAGATLRIKNAGKETAARFAVSAGPIAIEFDELEPGDEAKYTGLPSDVSVELFDDDDNSLRKQTVHLTAGEERELVFDAP